MAFKKLIKRQVFKQEKPLLFIIKMFKKRGKKAQVTLFVIIAVVIVALVISAIILVPKITKPKILKTDVMNPETYIADCIKDDLEPMVNLISKQGGYLDSENQNSIFYQDYFRTYLCYQSTPYTTCINQKPMLKEHVESVLKDRLKQDNIVSGCIEDFSSTARQKGYDVSNCSSSQLQFNVTLIQGKVTVPINCPIILDKDEEHKQFTTINPALNWPLYDFVIISQRIILDEQQKGTFDWVAYSQIPINRWVEITPFRINDNIKIYTIKERSTGKEFTFALSSWS